MNKQPPLKVPKGIKYLTQWGEFSLPQKPCIIDKKLTGCGFTEYVIRSPFNSVLISPRTSLLRNKVNQHNPMIDGKEIPGCRVLYYAKAEKEKEIEIDKDLEASKLKESKIESEVVDALKFKQDLKDAIGSFLLRKLPIKICVTYDSFRKVKEVLEELGMINQFFYIVDEFQVIFTDSRFKPDTELEFVKHLQGLQNVSFVSATPMMEDYLDEIDEFKDLPYYELDWYTEDPTRLISPELIVKSCRSVNTVAKKYITDLKNGIYEKRMRFDNYGNPIETVESRELVLYVNSVRNICDIIRQNELIPENVNIICARTEDNKKKIREAFRLVFKSIDRNSRELPSLEEVIGEVPTPDSQTGEVYNKPITLCTKTVYLGADFYSTNARSIILSDATVESLAVDITLDLPQILGRQRLISNPWKNSAEVWVKYGSKVGDISQDEFNSILEKKRKRTENLLSIYEKGTSSEKHDLAEKYLDALKVQNYRNDYVAINHHDRSDIVPQFNQLVLISEKRAFKIQTEDYANRFSVMATILNQFGLESIDQDIQLFLESIDSESRFRDKIKAICIYLQNQPDEVRVKLYPHIPEPFKTYYFTLGPEYIISVCGEKSKILAAMNSRVIDKVSSPEDLKNEVLKVFQIGEKYSKSYLKQEIGEIYKRLGISKTAKASDLSEWFGLKKIQTTNKETGKRDHGFEIISIKE